MFTSPKLMLPFQIALGMAALRVAEERKTRAGRHILWIPFIMNRMEGVRWLQQLFGPDAYPWFLALTYFGSSAVLWGIIGILYWLVNPRLGRRLAVVIGFGFVVNQIIKDVLETPRPYDLDPV